MPESFEHGGQESKDAIPENEGSLLKSVLGGEPRPESSEAEPLSRQLMSEFSEKYKKTEMYTSAKKIQDQKDAISRMYARATYGEDLMARWQSDEAKNRLKRLHYGKAGYDYYQDFRVHPEKIYAAMQHSVEYDLHGGGLKPNAWLVLQFLEGKSDAMQFIGAWEPVGKEYGNAILRSLIEEDLAKTGETMEQLKDRLLKAKAENEAEMKKRKEKRDLF